jgi:hypothetical protein
MHTRQDRQRGAHSPLGIVLVRSRRTEEGHDLVTDESVDRAAEALQIGVDTVVVRRYKRANIFGVELVRMGRGTYQVPRRPSATCFRVMPRH